MIDLDAEREYIIKLGDNVRKICKYVDKWQKFGDRLCPCAIYQDGTATLICKLPQTAICRNRYADCFKAYHATKRKVAALIAAAPIKTVYIPACDEHKGVAGVYVKLHWACPICGKPRGEPTIGRSYDGALVLYCDTWKNPCGHVDKYANCRKEATTNALQPTEEPPQ